MPCIGGNRIGVALGVSAAAVVGCCIYLDYKRRSAPGYRDRIRYEISLLHADKPCILDKENAKMPNMLQLTTLVS